MHTSISRNLSGIIAVATSFAIVFLATAVRANNHEDGDVRSRKPTLQKKTLRHDTLQRSFYIHLPTAFSETEKLPVVFALHGGGRADGAGIAKRFGLNELADRERFIVVYPNGVNNQWNDGRGKSYRKRASNANVDDVGFISKLIDHVIEEHHADKRRV